MFSCSREDFVGEVDEEIIIPPSEEVEVGEINIKVSDTNGDPLSSADISLYSGDSLVINTNTDENGTFLFRDLFTLESYLLVTEKDDYHTNYTVISQNHFEDAQLEIELLDTDAFGGPINELDPLDEDVIVISGTLVDEDGLPTEAFISYSWGAHFDIYFSFSFSGQFSILAPRSEEIRFQVIPQCATGPFEEFLLGPFAESTDVGELMLDSPAIDLVSAEVFDCSGLVDFGTVVIRDIFTGVVVDSIPIIDGTFEMEFDPCTGFDFELEIYIDGSVHYISDQNFELGVDPYTGEIIWTINICQALLESEGEISVIVGTTDTIYFDQVQTIFDPILGLGFIATNYYESMIFFIDATGTGAGSLEYPMYVQFLFSSGGGYTAEAPAILELEEPIFLIPGNDFSLEGDFSGELLNGAGMEVDFEGTIDIDVVY